MSGKNTVFHSAYAIGDHVWVRDNDPDGNATGSATSGRVVGVSFTESKVYYDVDPDTIHTEGGLPLGYSNNTRHHVDSIHIEPCSSQWFGGNLLDKQVAA